GPFTQRREFPAHGAAPDLINIRWANRVNYSLPARRLSETGRTSKQRIVDMHKVNIGIVGAGFIAELHAESYARVSGYDAHLAAVAAPPTRRAAFQEKYGISKAYETYEEL